jgi:hypothetical protein
MAVMAVEAGAGKEVVVEGLAASAAVLEAAGAWVLRRRIPSLR